jgi:hypothetical protein
VGDDGVLKKSGSTTSSAVKFSSSGLHLLGTHFAPGALSPRNGSALGSWDRFLY